MFERAHHRRIAAILSALDGAYLREKHCYFGGGTAIALRHGEYRDSLDIDFLISDKVSYRELRERISEAGIAALALPASRLSESREWRLDQYGLRTMLEVEGDAVKLDIVLEARIEFEVPLLGESIVGVSTLSRLDLAASKLLAHSDRWRDDSVNSRDLIDLAMMELDSEILRRAIVKASATYGASVERDLRAAVATLARRRGRLEDCMRKLQMLDVPPGVVPVPPALLWARIKRLVPPVKRKNKIE